MRAHPCTDGGAARRVCKVETDVDEVLQAHTIFADVGRGVLAQSEDMIDAFGTDDEDVVCIEVLNKGEFQVSEAERAMQLDALKGLCYICVCIEGEYSTVLGRL